MVLLLLVYKFLYRFYQNAKTKAYVYRCKLILKYIFTVVLKETTSSGLFLFFLLYVTEKFTRYLTYALRLSVNIFDR